MRQPSFSTVLPANRADPFNTLPFELSRESRLLLDHCESISDNPPFALTADFSLTTHNHIQSPTIEFCFKRPWSRNETLLCSNFRPQMLHCCTARSYWLLAVGREWAVGRGFTWNQSFISTKQKQFELSMRDWEGGHLLLATVPWELSHVLQFSRSVSTLVLP
jgi:hypothetical protein